MKASGIERHIEYSAHCADGAPLRETVGRPRVVISCKFFRIYFANWPP